MGGYIYGVYSGGSGPRTLTTPTATEIVNGLVNVAIGTSFQIWISNRAAAPPAGGKDFVLTAGSGITITGTPAIGNARTRQFLVVVNNVGTPAVEIISLSYGDN